MGRPVAARRAAAQPPPMPAKVGEAQLGRLHGERCRARSRRRAPPPRANDHRTTPSCAQPLRSSDDAVRARRASPPRPRLDQVRPRPGRSASVSPVAAEQMLGRLEAGGALRGAQGSEARAGETRARAASWRKLPRRRTTSSTPALCVGAVLADPRIRALAGAADARRPRSRFSWRSPPTRWCCRRLRAGSLAGRAAGAVAHQGRGGPSTLSIATSEFWQRTIGA